MDIAADTLVSAGIALAAGIWTVYTFLGKKALSRLQHRLPLSEFLIKHADDLNIKHSTYFRERMFSDYYGKTVSNEEINFINTEDLNSEQISTYFKGRYATRLWQENGKNYICIKTYRFKLPFRKKRLQLLRQKLIILAIVIGSVSAIFISTALMLVKKFKIINLLLLLKLIKTLNWD